MSLQAALGFIAAVRDRDAVRARVAACRVDESLDALVAMGRDAGYVFTSAELRQAHAHDWSLRWIREDQRSSQ